jgi:hypothetical protein
VCSNTGGIIHKRPAEKSIACNPRWNHGDEAQRKSQAETVLFEIRHFTQDVHVTYPFRVECSVPAGVDAEVCAVRRAIEVFLAVLGCAILGLVVTLVLAGIGQSGVVGMQITHALFWLAFVLSIVTAPMAAWLLSQSVKGAVVAFVATAVIVGGGLLWLDVWLRRELDRQAMLNQPPPAIHTSAPPPIVPIIKTPHLTGTPNQTKTQQDNSVHIGKDAFLAQKSTGDCSPNIVGGSNTVNCGPPVQKSELALAVSLVGPTAPAIVVENQTDNLVEGITWELVMFRTTDQAFFSYATQNIGYIKPHSQSARYAMQLNTLVQAPGGGPIADGECFIGALSVDCPTCRGTTLIVSFVWDRSGWFYEVPDGNGRLVLPKDMSKDTVSKFIESLNAAIKAADRTPIL